MPFAGQTALALCITFACARALARSAPSPSPLLCQRPGTTPPLGSGTTSTTVTITNPTKSTVYLAHPVRLHPANASSCPAVVVRNTTDCGASCAGAAVAPLVPSQVTDGFVWILESIVPGKVHSYSIECRAGPMPSAVHGVAHPPKISAKVERRGAAYILSNPTVRLAIAAAAGAGRGAPPPPFQGMTVDGPAGTLVGGSFWNTSLGILSFESQVEASALVDGVQLVGQVAEPRRGDPVALADRGDELVDGGHGGGFPGGFVTVHPRSSADSYWQHGGSQDAGASPRSRVHRRGSY